MNKLMSINPDNYNHFFSILIRFFQLVLSIYNKFVKDTGFARAGSLAFSTLLAIVPFVALIISLLTAFGAFDTFQQMIMDFIVQLLIPTRQAEATKIIDQFLSNSSTLGVVGLVFFTITSVMLLNTITENLNAIWGSRTKANFISKFTTYASVIIFGTLLLAASTTLTSRVNLIHIENIAILSRILLKVAPFFFDFFVIILLIGLTPSGKIQLKYLILVSAIGSGFWELLKFAFFHISSGFMRMSVIYGTIAIVPIFLFWVYIIWMIILGCLETAWILQHKKYAWMGKPMKEMTPYEELTFGFELFIYIAEAYDTGKTPPGSEEISGRFSVSIRDVRDMTDILKSHNLLMQAGDDGQSWIPSRSLSKIKTIELIEAVFGRQSNTEQSPEEIVNQIEIFYSSGIHAIKDSCISDLLIQIKPQLYP